jgi:hypothetical protein
MWLEGAVWRGLSNECWVEIRSVNLGVAIRAGCHDCGTLPHAVEGAFRNRTVTLIAQSVDRGHIQQPCVLRTMRTVATKATHSLHSGMFKHKRSACVHVALRANPVLVSSGPQVIGTESAMHIMAICALHCTFRDWMMKWHPELSLHVGVAALTKLRLFRQQQLGSIRVMHAVATDAAYARLRVR